MKSKPLISVVIPSYNYAKYLPEAIESALGQTYKNIELIVINDGSADNTDQVAQKYKNRIRYISRENKGIIATRNEGIRLSKGEYIIQLDADDYLDREYVEKSLRAAHDHNADIVYTQAHIFGRDEFNTQYIAFDLEKLKHDNFIHASSLVRKEALKDIQYDSYLNDKGYEDWDLVLGMCLAGSRAVLVDEPLLHYRKHSSSISRSDAFGGTFKEMLVRHHIWNKYNNKYPEEFWYFSSQINLLLRMIKLGQEAEHSKVALQLRNTEVEILKSRIKKLENRDPITISKKVSRKVGQTVRKFNN